MANSLTAEMREYAALVRKNNPDWSDWEIAEDVVEEMKHRHGPEAEELAVAITDTWER